MCNFHDKRRETRTMEKKTKHFSQHFKCPCGRRHRMVDLVLIHSLQSSTKFTQTPEVNPSAAPLLFSLGLRLCCIAPSFMYLRFCNSCSSPSCIPHCSRITAGVGAGGASRLAAGATRVKLRATCLWKCIC